ncbi:hypothetical protein [Chondromyces apiculatus]|uniref:Uncharacterized protein n=1 Tax=Chondromyces apiculatus DSM 436 TaxID=1192034 RepID=A0A017TAM8_9BACT|nr:hypothetical protein [Chondromyces apiculatus]EYF05962.1 Hypothetical protein CAP_2421 [Chondromyces apiculatus DSM 436]
MKPAAPRPGTNEANRQQKLRMPGSRNDEDPSEEGSDRFAWKGAALVAVAVAGLVVWRMCSPGSEEKAPDGSIRAAGTTSATAKAAAPPRCAAAAPPFVVDAEKRPRKATGDKVTPEEEPEPEQLAPFAVEVGRGAAFEGGFAVGALREGEGGAMGMVAFVGADGAGGRLVRLTRSRGDLEPPAVASAGKAVITAMLEPNAGGRAIRVAKVEGDQVTWGAELAEGRDESLALDVATSGARAVVVWDDVTRDGKRSQIMMASLDTATLRSVTSPRPISVPTVDAEVPRLLSRAGGYWLVYIARSDERAGGAAEGGARKGAKGSDGAGAAKGGTKAGATAKAGAKAGTKKNAERFEEVLDEDTEAPGEMIASQWLEVVPLDETGSPAGSARSVTPRDGHVLAFDLAAGDEGSVLIAYRDNDTPSGSSGGRVSMLSVGLGRVGEAQVVAGEEKTTPGSGQEGVVSGVPSVLPGWLSVASATGATLLAALGGQGEILDGLATEAVIGGGEPIAAAGGSLLVARPAGTAVKLEVLKCMRGAKAEPPPQPSLPSVPEVGDPRGPAPGEPSEERAPPAPAEE